MKGKKKVVERTPGHAEMAARLGAQVARFNELLYKYNNAEHKLMELMRMLASTKAATEDERKAHAAELDEQRKAYEKMLDNAYAARAADANHTTGVIEGLERALKLSMDKAIEVFAEQG